ncbi:MAG: hypothetical protein KC636_22745 [Myxococcales bacterium]|nr:hypothetical protein [Myxococcales bacterium]
MNRWIALLGALACACVDTGGGAVAVPLYVAGTAQAGPIDGKDGVTIELARAELAFGPLYLCAGAQAGELCETARLEWLESAVVDALDDAPREVGALTGVTGWVRSWMFDLGVTSLLTRDEPLALAAADALDGASVALEGVAHVGDVALPFRAAALIQQEEQTERGVPVLRKSASEEFEHEVTVAEAGLLVRFDPAPWVAQIDFASYLVEETCSIDGPTIACAGAVEQRCAGADVEATRDCAALDALCLRGIGCASELELEAGGQGLKAIRDQVVAGPRPTFTWGYEG